MEKELTGLPSVDQMWLKFYEKEMIDQKVEEKSIFQFFYDNNKDYPNEIGLEYINKKITFGEMFQKIERIASAFIESGIKAGDIVTVALPSCPEALYCIYALNKIGAVSNMIHPLAGCADICNYINEVKSKCVVMFTKTYEICEKEINNTTAEQLIVVSAGDSLGFPLKQLLMKKEGTEYKKNSKSISWKQFVKRGKNPVPTVERNIYEMALISHTGGTTGTPKGVMCSDYGINSIISAIGYSLPHERQERYLSVLPPFINYSLINSMLEPLAFGFTAILIPKYEVEKFDEYVAKYRPNHITSIPAYWEALLLQEKHGDYSSLKHVYYGGEKMAEEKENAINEILLSHGAQHPLKKGLGSTEMMSAATVAYDQCNDIGCVGIPLLCVNCKITDVDTGKELPVDEIGEICFSGNSLMLGYYENQEATDDVIKMEDGVRWMHTGDLGYLNEDGVLYITGRIKRIIMTKGNDGMITKLFPDRVENEIYKVSGVLECCVVGVPDDKRINTLKAFIVADTEAVKEIEDVVSAVKELCEKALPDYSIPSAYEVIDILPRTERGKVDFKVLEEKQATK